MTGKSPRRKRRTRDKKQSTITRRTLGLKSTAAKVGSHSKVNEPASSVKSIIENKALTIRDHHIISELKRIGILAGIILAILVVLAFVLT